MAWGLPKQLHLVQEGDVPPTPPPTAGTPLQAVLLTRVALVPPPSCDSRLVAAMSPGPSSPAGVAEKAIPTGTMQALGAGGRGAGGTCLDSARGGDGCWRCAAPRVSQVQPGSMSLPNAQHLVLAFRLCHTAPPSAPLHREAWLAEPALTFQRPPPSSSVTRSHSSGQPWVLPPAKCPLHQYCILK